MKFILISSVAVLCLVSFVNGVPVLGDRDVHGRLKREDMAEGNLDSRSPASADTLASMGEAETRRGGAGEHGTAGQHGTAGEQGTAGEHGKKDDTTDIVDEKGEHRERDDPENRRGGSSHEEVMETMMETRRGGSHEKMTAMDEKESRRGGSSHEKITVMEDTKARRGGSSHEEVMETMMETRRGGSHEKMTAMEEKESRRGGSSHEKITVMENTKARRGGSSHEEVMETMMETRRGGSSHEEVMETVMETRRGGSHEKMTVMEEKESRRGGASHEKIAIMGNTKARRGGSSHEEVMEAVMETRRGGSSHEQISSVAMSLHGKMMDEGARAEDKMRAAMDQFEDMTEARVQAEEQVEAFGDAMQAARVEQIAELVGSESFGAAPAAFVEESYAPAPIETMISGATVFGDVISGGSDIAEGATVLNPFPNPSETTQFEEVKEIVPVATIPTDAESALDLFTSSNPFTSTSETKTETFKEVAKKFPAGISSGFNVFGVPRRNHRSLDLAGLEQELRAKQTLGEGDIVSCTVQKRTVVESRNFADFGHVFDTLANFASAGLFKSDQTAQVVVVEEVEPEGEAAQEGLDLVTALESNEPAASTASAMLTVLNRSKRDLLEAEAKAELVESVLEAPVATDIHATVGEPVAAEISGTVLSGPVAVDEVKETIVEEQAAVVEVLEEPVAEVVAVEQEILAENPSTPSSYSEIAIATVSLIKASAASFKITVPAAGSEAAYARAKQAFALGVKEFAEVVPNILSIEQAISEKAVFEGFTRLNAALEQTHTELDAVAEAKAPTIGLRLIHLIAITHELTKAVLEQHPPPLATANVEIQVAA